MHNEKVNGKSRARLAQAGRANSAGAELPQRVWFEFSNAAAREVTIAGSFNNWDVSNLRMVHVGRGRWLRVIFLQPGRYEYLFVVDGRCVVDPRATESAPNVFGCANSVLSVPAQVRMNSCLRRATGLPARAVTSIACEISNRTRPKTERAGTLHSAGTPAGEDYFLITHSHFRRRQTTETNQ